MTRGGISDRIVVGLLAVAFAVTALAVVVRLARAVALAGVESPSSQPVVPAEPAKQAAPPAAAPGDTVGPTTAPIFAAAVSPTGRLVVTLDDSGEVVVWDLRAQTQIARFASEMKPSRRKSFDVPIVLQEPAGIGVEGAIVAIGGDDGILRAWSARSGERILTAAHSTRDAASEATRQAPIVDAAVTTKGRLVSVSANGSVAYWIARQPGDSSLIAMSRGPAGTVRDVEVSPADTIMAVATDDAVYLSRMHRDHVDEPGSRRWTMLDRVRGQSLVAMAFTADGRDLTTAWSNGEIRVHLLHQDGRYMPSLPGRGERPTRIALAPNDGPIAISGGHRMVRLWWRSTTHTDSVVADGPVRSMWLSPDGQSVIVADGGRYLHRLPVPTPPWRRPPPPR